MPIRQWAPRAAAVCVFVLTVVRPVAAGVISVPGDFSTISAAVAAAANGDRIELAPGVYTGAANRNVSISGKAVEIVSADGDASTCVIDLENGGRAFAIVSSGSGTVLIGDVTIRNGTASNGRGAAVFAQSATVSLVGVVVESCDVTTGGGAVFATQGSLSVRGCVFDTNSASLSAGPSRPSTRSA